MAASRMSRIPSHRLALLLAVVCATLTHTLAQTQDTAAAPEGVEDVELITVPRAGSEYVAISGGDSDVGVDISPSDLKKHSLNNKKFQKFYPKTEADWNFKGEGKKSDVFIKDPKDFRLQRLISEGILNPQDTLPIVSNDAITSSQINNSSEDISVNVQPEGMSGLVNEGISADSDERIIMEKKKNATKEKISKYETEASKESNEDIKVNLDASAGVQSPAFVKQKGSIAVPAQKQISLSKGKENALKKPSQNEASNYEVLSLKPSKEKSPVADEGVFDFVDSPLSDKHLVPAGTAQTSRINVKKGPNGQDYEYEYIYYYYEDEGETSAQNAADKSPKINEIPVSTAAPTQRTTTPAQRFSSTTPKYTKTFSDDSLGTRIKTVDVLNEGIPLPQHNREKFRYSLDNAGLVPQPVSSVPSKSSFSNEVHYQSQFNSARFPGRQAIPQSVSEQPVVTVAQEPVSTTARPISSRGRAHHNTASQHDNSAFVTPQIVPVQTKEPQARTKSSGIRQPGLELVDSNSFRTHSTSAPTDYEKSYTQFESQPRGKSLKQNSDDLGITQNLPSPSSSTKSDLYQQKDHVVQYVDDSARIAVTASSRVPSTSSAQVTETVVDNTAPFSTLSDNSLTTVYGAGLTDKAAHDLYAIYQQTQNEESKSFSQDDRTTIVDDSENTYYPTNIPTTSVFSTSTTTTTTTTTPAPTTTTTTQAPIVSSPAPGRGRFRGNAAIRTKLGSSTSTEASASVSESSPSTENTEKPRPKFQPTNRREPGPRVSAYGRKSTTTGSPIEQDSSTAASKDLESSKPSFATRNRFRGGSVRSELGASTEGQSTSSPQQLKPNFADRYNTRRRSGLRTSTTPAPSGEEDVAVKLDTTADQNATEQQSTTFRSIRNKITSQGSQVRPLRPGPKLSLSSRSKQTPSTTSTTVNTPIDADTSGSADVPVEQKQPEENAEHEEAVSETVITTPSTTTLSTPPPDALTRLKNRPKLRITDKGNHAKVQSQQSNNTAALNQNRKQLVNNLLPRKKQPTPQAEVQEPKEEKHENLKPVNEDVAEDSSPKSDPEVAESSPQSETSSTTESKLSSLIASRRRNLSARRPGTLVQANKQTANEES